jgi:hypothetical protein
MHPISSPHIVATLALGLRSRQRACKGASQDYARESHFHAPRSAKECEGKNLHTPKWTPMLGVGVPMDSRMFRKWLQGSKPNGSRVHYIIGKLLKHRCLKWARITYLNIWNTSYGQKKGQESNWQFDSRPLKVKNQPDFLACKWHATYRWKALNEGYNFASNLISIEGFHTKLWGSKVAGVLILAISGLPLGSLGTKSHLDVGLMERHIVYYKGEGGGFPQVWAVVSLVSPSLPMARLNTKSAPTMH